MSRFAEARPSQVGPVSTRELPTGSRFRPIRPRLARKDGDRGTLPLRFRRIVGVVLAAKFFLALAQVALPPLQHLLVLVVRSFDLAQEVRVIVWGLGASWTFLLRKAGRGCQGPRDVARGLMAQRAASDQPRDPTDDVEYQDDEDPRPFGQVANLLFGCNQTVDQAKHPEPDEYHDRQQAEHPDPHGVRMPRG